MAITIDGTDGISPLKASGQTQTTSGTAAAPAIASSSDSDSGFFFGTNEVNISTGGSTRATVDSAGRLLVATTSSDAQAKLVIQGQVSNSAAGAILNIQRGEAASSITSGEGIGNIAFTDNANKQFASINAQADGTAGTNDFPGRILFQTTADGASSPTERMRINAAGQITTPNQPSFHAVRTGDTHTQTGSDNFVPYTGTRHNRGSHYSTSTYRFTAPVAGHYLFFAIVYRSSGSFGSMQIKKNNTTHYSFTEYEAYDNNAHFYGIAIVDLGANDYAHVVAGNYRIDGNSFFGGYLLG